MFDCSWLFDDFYLFWHKLFLGNKYSWTYGKYECSVNGADPELQVGYSRGEASLWLRFVLRKLILFFLLKQWITKIAALVLFLV